jgi:adenosylhomocysteine nucleosidase
VKSEVRNPKSEANPKPEIRKVLVCFALKEEARPFQQWAGGRDNIKVILVGMGKRNAERAIRDALAEEQPRLVLTCGSAGGLRPELTIGSVVFEADAETGLEPALLVAGAQRGCFHCSDRVATTAAEKRALRQSTGADAVEMESEVIRAVCREQNIPSATVRAILDSAEEDLPLDFNPLLTAEQKLSYARLALALVKSPGKVAALLRLRKHSQAAARSLADVLARITAAG